MRGWDIWLAICLLILGGGCLVASTAIPFSPVRDDAVRVIHVLEFCVIAFILVLLLWMGGRIMWKKTRREFRCERCRQPLETRWNYCPTCGARVGSASGFGE